MNETNKREKEKEKANIKSKSKTKRKGSQKSTKTVFFSERQYDKYSHLRKNLQSMKFMT